MIFFAFGYGLVWLLLLGYTLLLGGQLSRLEKQILLLEEIAKKRGRA